MMRRSSAPSVGGLQKRGRFSTPFVSKSSQSETKDLYNGENHSSSACMPAKCACIQNDNISCCLPILWQGIGMSWICQMIWQYNIAHTSNLTFSLFTHYVYTGSWQADLFCDTNGVSTFHLFQAFHQPLDMFLNNWVLGLKHWSLTHTGDHWPRFSACWSLPTLTVSLAALTPSSRLQLVAWQQGQLVRNWAHSRLKNWHQADPLACSKSLHMQPVMCQQMGQTQLLLKKLLMESGGSLTLVYINIDDECLSEHDAELSIYHHAMLVFFQQNCCSLQYTNIILMISISLLPL